MAFTFAHPAIFMRTVGRKEKYLSSSALIIGAMAPDFEYFISFRPVGVIGHQLKGFFLMNLPLAILLYLIWHFIVKRPLLTHSPAFIGERLSLVYNSEFGLSSWKKVFVFIYSAILGMASHVIWDSFTHNTGFFVGRISFLQTKVFGIYIYKYLQHGSTLLGLLFIIFFIYKCERQELPKVTHLEKILFFTILIFLYGVILYFMMLWVPYVGVGTMIITVINAFLLATVGAVCMVNIKDRITK
jgi:hypothetical protein